MTRKKNKKSPRMEELIPDAHLRERVLSHLYSGES